MTKTLKAQKASKPSAMRKPALVGGELITVLIDRTEEKLINRYSGVFKTADLPGFVKSITHSTLRWMERMINGTCQFELQTMDYWRYDESTMVLKTTDLIKDYSVAYSMEFTTKSINEYHIGLGEILSSFWYKSYAIPPCVVELIACCDLLYSKHHNNTSPAADSGTNHVDLDIRKKLTDAAE